MRCHRLDQDRRSRVIDANAVGDLTDSLPGWTRSDPVIAELRAERRENGRAKHQEDRRGTQGTASSPMRSGWPLSNGLARWGEPVPGSLEQWKALPRLDRATDDELWHRFSSARTTYTRRRKAHFAQQAEQREAAQTIKEKLVAEAEAIADTIDWGAGRRRLSAT